MEKNRYHIVIASVVFAVLVWVSVNMTDEYTYVTHLAVVIENMAEGKALKFPIPKTVTVSFKGRGWQLAGIYLARDLKYYIDVSSLTSSEYVITSRNLFEHVTVPMAVQPVDVKPETLVLALADFKEKHVPVTPLLTLKFREGYGQVGQVKIAPESVVIGGAENVIQPITQWRSVYRRYEKLHAPVDEDIGIEEPTDFSLDVTPHSARLQIDVQPFAEKTFSGVPLTATMVPPNREVIFIPPKMDVIARGGIDQLARLSVSDFQALVAYQTLVEDSVGTVTPLFSAPPEVTVISRNPKHFQFVIRKKL